MNLQPGIGYGFTSSAYGASLITNGPFLDEIPPVTYDPFKVINLGLIDGVYKFKVIPGTVNSIIPQLGITASAARRLDAVPTPTETWNFDTTTNQSYIYLKVSCDTSADPQKYPVDDQSDSLYPRVVSTIVEQANDEDSGYVLLASAYKDPTTNAITVTQYVFSSIWSERHQYENPELTYYYFWRS